MTTRTRPDEDVLLDDEANATQKRRRLSSPQQLDVKPLTAWHDADRSLYEDIDTIRTPDRDAEDVEPIDASMQREQVDLQAQSSSSRHLVDVLTQDARINHNDSSGNAGRPTSQVHSPATMSASTGEGDERLRADGGRTSTATPSLAKRLNAGASATRSSGELAHNRAHAETHRWSAADEKALLEFVARDVILRAWAKKPQSEWQRNEKGAMASIEHFLKPTPASSPRFTYHKLHNWRTVYRGLLAQLTSRGQSTRVSTWSSESDRKVLFEFEAESRNAYQWLRQWHDLVHLDPASKATSDVPAFSSASRLVSSSHERPRAAMPQRFQPRAVISDASSSASSSRQSFDNPRTDSSSTNASSLAVAVGRSSGSGSSSNALAAFERRLEQLERQNSALRAENKEHRQLIFEQKSLLERQAQQIERLDQQVDCQDQQNERQDQQMERLEQQTERSEQQSQRLQQQVGRLEQTVEKQAQALDRNALALQRRAQAAEREAQKVERLAQRLDRQS